MSIPSDAPFESSPALLEPLRFDTTALSEAEGFAAFRAAISNFDVAKRGEHAFEARALIWRIGEIVLNRCTVGPTRFTRDAMRVRRDDVDHFVFMFLYRGRLRADFGNGSRVLGGDSFFTLDMRRPYATVQDRIEFISLAVPRRLALAHCDRFPAHGAMLAKGLAPVLGSALRGIAQSLPRTRASAADGIERMLLDLVASGLAQGPDSASGITVAERLQSRLDSYVDRNIAHPLTTAMLAAALNVSRSTLYRALESSGGLANYVRKRRLRYAHALLTDPAIASPISDIGALCGFADASHFNRVFKQHYGVTPGQLRSETHGSLVRGAASGADAPQLYRRWSNPG